MAGNNDLEASVNVSTTGEGELQALQGQLKSVITQIKELQAVSSKFDATHPMVRGLAEQRDALQAQITELENYQAALRKSGEELIAQNTKEMAAARMMREAGMGVMAERRRANAETVSLMRQQMAEMDRANRLQVTMARDYIAQQNKMGEAAKSRNRDEVATAQMVRQYHSGALDLKKTKEEREAEAEAKRNAPKYSVDRSGLTAAQLIRAQRGISTSSGEQPIGRSLASNEIIRAGNAVESYSEKVRRATAAQEKLLYPGRSLTSAEILRARRATAGIEEDLSTLGSTGSGGAAGTNVPYYERNKLGKLVGHGVALVDEGARGNRSAMMATMGAALRDLGLSTGTLIGGMTGLAAVMATVKFAEGASTAAQFAQATSNAAAAAGMSVTQFSQLQGALVLTGMKSDAADTALRQFAEHIGEALANPASKSAQALHALGISQEFINSHAGDTHAIFLRVADALSSFGDSATKAEAQEALFGKGAEKITDLTQRGAAGVSEFENKAKSLGTTLDNTSTRSLTTMGQKLDLLDQTIHGQVLKNYAAWSTAIGDIATALTVVIRLIGDTTAALGNLSARPDMGGHLVGRTFVRDKPKPEVFGPPMSAMAPKPLVPAFGGPKTPSDAMQEAEAQIALAKDQAASQYRGGTSGLGIAELQAEIKTIQSLLGNKSSGLDPRQQLTLRAQMYRDEAQLVGDNLRTQSTAFKQGYEEFAAAERLKIAEAGKDAKAIAQIYTEWLNVISTKYKENAKEASNVMRSEVTTLQRLKDEAAKATISSIAQSTHSGSAVDAAKVSQLKVSQLGSPLGSQDTTTSDDEATSREIVQSALERIKALQQYTDASKNSASVVAAANNAIVQIITQTDQKIIELYKDSGVASQGIGGAFKTMFNGLSQQTDEFSRQLLTALAAPQLELIHAGLTTIRINLRGQQVRQAVGNLFIGMADDLVNQARKGLMKLAGEQLLKIPGVAGIAQKLMPSHAADFGLTTGNMTAFNSALVQATVALHTLAPAAVTNAGAHSVNSAAVTTGATAHGTNTVATVTNSVAKTANTTATAGSTIALIAHTLKTWADNIATEADTVVKWALAGFSGGGIVPSAAGGMVVGGMGSGAQLAILHAREMVLPAHLSEGVQHAIKGGSFGGKGGNTNSAHLVYAPQINTGRRGGGMGRGELSSLLNSHATSLIGEARNLMRKGWRP